MTVAAVEKQMQDAGEVDRPGRRRRLRRWRIIGWICLWAIFAMTAVIAGKASPADAASPSPPRAVAPMAS
ncbi:hypothetical protein [Marilutibacter chinensis]|uniref:Uncharacterized protein n=1 Tax=Marilutibacter chinensis TaxID=2912247 RepID=A0ABS9HVE4_9GAMM|nr:hypothetical protein [Lysobacter chinensis]MCF7222871.1 hypothetical protein [Lysobacter chinensis]